jgi:iron(III) transport system permease protein
MRTKEIGPEEMAPIRGGDGGGQGFSLLASLLGRTRFDWKWLIIGVCVAITVYLALVPLLYLLWQSFFTPQTAAKAAEFTFGNYVSAYASPDTIKLVTNSLEFACGTAAFSFLLGTSLAWMNERTNAPLKSLFFALSLVPLVIPGVLFTVSWIMLGSSKIGLINLAAQRWFGLDSAPFDVYSMGGMIWVDGLHYSPMAFLLMSAAFRAMDPSLEESAMMSGASVPQVLWRITLRLAWPAVFATFLILFVRSIESFEVPALLGLPAGINVFTSSIYEAIHRYPSQVGLASSYAMSLLLLTSAGTYFVSRLSASGSKYATMTGKGFRPRQIDLGPWRWPLAGIFIVYFMLILVLPLAVLVWSSLQHYYAVPSAAAFKHLTLDPYRAVLAYPNLWHAVWNSLLLSFGAATSIMLITSVICWIVVKTKFPARWLLDNLSSLPMVFPGLVLGLSVMIFYLHVDIGVYGTLWILFIAYVTRFMPYGLRFNTTSMLQIHKELEESSAMSGASWSTTFFRIILPLLKPGLISGWIYIMIVSIRELSSSILLYSPGNEVISIVIWEFWENGQYVELSALAVMFIVMLLMLVMGFQLLARRFGIKEH